MSRTRRFGAGVLIVLGLSGCPVTDDYFIEAHPATGSAGDASNSGTSTGAESSGGSDALPQGGKAQAGTESAQGGAPQAGSAGHSNPSGGKTTAGDTTVITAGGPAGGAPDPGQGGDAAGGAPPCVPSTERCNGHDDDCDDLTDELVCNSNQNGTTGCTGFTLSPGSNHGYMLCTGAPKDWQHATDICEGQNMRLAWLESSRENSDLSATIMKLTNEIDIMFGATDQGREGDWLWDGNGGFQFWKGLANGVVVGGAFNAWSANAPNNANNSEDCAVLNPSTAGWGDRSCGATFPYVCEELN